MPNVKVLLLNPPGRELYIRGGHCSTASKARYYLPTKDLLIQSGILAQMFDVRVVDAIIEMGARWTMWSRSVAENSTLRC